MTAEPAPGQAAYEVMYRASGVDVRWEDLDGDDQRLWDDIAAAAAAPLRAQLAELASEGMRLRAAGIALQTSHAHLEAQVTALTRALEKEAAKDAEIERLRGDVEDYRAALCAMQRERDALRERLAEAEAIARECEAELQEVYDVLVTAYGHEDLSEDTPSVVAALAAERDKARADADRIRIADAELRARLGDLASHWEHADQPDGMTRDETWEQEGRRGCARELREALEGDGDG